MVISALTISLPVALLGPVELPCRAEPAGTAGDTRGWCRRPGTAVDAAVEVRGTRVSPPGPTAVSPALCVAVAGAEQGKWPSRAPPDSAIGCPNFLTQGTKETSFSVLSEVLLNVHVTKPACELL